MIEPALIKVDLNSSTIQARYNDELSLQRAKRRWKMLFEEIFLIDRKTDFELYKSTDPDRCFFTLTCKFTSMVGRYVFLRLQSDPHAPAFKTLKVAHYPNFPTVINENESKDSKKFLMRLLQYFQAS